MYVECTTPALSKMFSDEKVGMIFRGGQKTRVRASSVIEFHGMHEWVRGGGLWRGASVFFAVFRTTIDF
jgi:hypothetical protein